ASLRSRQPIHQRAIPAAHGRPAESIRTCPLMRCERRSHSPIGHVRDIRRFRQRFEQVNQVACRRSDRKPMTTPKRSHLQAMAKKVAILVAKLFVTGACFWYVSRQIDLNQVLSAIPLLDFRWAAFAVLVAILQIPLSGLRWYNIVGSLAARDMRAT